MVGDGYYPYKRYLIIISSEVIKEGNTQLRHVARNHSEHELEEEVSHTLNSDELEWHTIKGNGFACCQGCIEVGSLGGTFGNLQRGGGPYLDKFEARE